MNLFAVIILIALVSEFAINILADVLNLRKLKTDLPESLAGYHDQNSYRKSQEYLRVNTRFGWLTSTFSLALILVFWFLGGFNVLDQIIRNYNLGPVSSGVLFIGILVAGKALIFLPFSIYDTFVIEEAFGFNKTSVKVFITDTVKGIVLAVGIGGPLLAVILLFFERTGPYAWIVCWITVVIFMLIMQFLVPSVIMPLFNTFEPIEEGDLKKSLMEYAASIAFPLTHVFRMDGSKRSSKSNAFFTGFGKSKRIVLYDTLIEQHTVPELVGVLAHEMGHFKLNHIKKNLVIAILQSGFMFYILSLCLSRKGLFDAFYMEHVSVYAGLVFFSMLFTPVDFFSHILMNMYSRKNEYEADRFAVITTQDNRSIKEALIKLSVNNLGNLFPHPFYVLLNYSHPPLMDRIYRIEKTIP